MPSKLKVAAAALALLLYTPALIQPGPAQAQTAPDTSAAGELAYWNKIKGSSDPAQFKAYLDTYPNGMFTDLAKSKYSSLTGGDANVKAATKPMVKTEPAAKPKSTRHMKGKPAMGHAAAHKTHHQTVSKKRGKRHKVCHSAPMGACHAQKPPAFNPAPDFGSHGGGGRGGGGWGH